MGDYVIFTLAAPMGGFGGPAGHERRGGTHWPARSALLGLVGAALGVRRDDRAGQGALRRWQTAVSILSESHPLQDFHTAQTVPTANIKRPATRRAALTALKPTDNATLSRRDYRTDCAFGVALWGGEDPQAVADALNAPQFTPYMGRKSCPFAAPMAARVVVAEAVPEALASITPPPWMTAVTPRQIISDAPLEGGWSETQSAEPIDRDLWHFGLHQLHVTGPRG
ncbi:type I-E CRISPR-associated protein Cas5/CasD [Palleronia caenipelagi]|nr:type I-E CRISPR-associated protein Cas5/CasD [Palleronia caenipelagi]